MPGSQWIYTAEQTGVQPAARDVNFLRKASFGIPRWSTFFFKFIATVAKSVCARMAAATKADRAKQKAEQDAILARVSVALARSQRLIDSWLPASSTPSNDNPEHDTSTHEGDLNSDWGGLPDRVGLGGKVQGANGAASSNGGGELDKLRKQLLGKRAGKGVAGLSAPRPGLNASKPMHGVGLNSTNQQKDADKRKPDSESEDEGGRSAAFKSKKHKTNGAPLKVHPAIAALESGVVQNKPEDDDDSEAEQSQAKAQNGKRKMSYLDEVLAERSQKKKKKKKNKKNQDAIVGT